MGEEEGMVFAPEISARRAKMAATSPLPPSTAVPAHVLTPTATTTCQYHGMAKSRLAKAITHADTNSYHNNN
jgi:hypothetical protein